MNDRTEIDDQNASGKKDNPDIPTPYNVGSVYLITLTFRNT